MRLLKPAWLNHSDEHRLYEIYSIHVSPDGERLATGGLDGKIRIWSTKAVFNSANESTNSFNEKHLLCSMSTHTGAVTVVRFSPCGRWLASGSDDRVVLIWELDESRAPRAPEFGTPASEANSETWVARKRLIGHDNDVQDLAWSPDSSLLVTVGLDSAIIIWSGTTFEKLKRFDIHQSHVKGVTFDPANKYFATASDDRTVKIIRYHHNHHQQAETSFNIEATISQPFKGSPLSTYYRRCSWSPDGNHIAAANATNGPVTTVTIINRGTWDSDISLVGHDAPCEIASFCPRMFSMDKDPIYEEELVEEEEDDEEQEQAKEEIITKSSSGDNNNNNINENKQDGNNNLTVKKMKKKNKKKKSQPIYPNLITVIATAGQDKTLAIWNTSNPRPLLVARNIASKSITDIAWSNSGQALFASSLDGSILVALFEPGELGWVVPLEENKVQLVRYGGGQEASQIPESTGLLQLEKIESKKQQKEEDTTKIKKDQDGDAIILEAEAKKSSPLQNPSSSSSSSSGIPQKPDLNTKDRKKILDNVMGNSSGTIQSDSNTTSTPPPSITSDTTTTTTTNTTTPNTNTPTFKKKLSSQKITITKDGKKRVAPMLISSGSIPTSNASSSSAAHRKVSLNAGNIASSPMVVDYTPPSNALPQGGIPSLLISSKRKQDVLGPNALLDGSSTNDPSSNTGAAGTAATGATTTAASTSTANSATNGGISSTNGTNGHHNKKPRFTEIQYIRPPIFSPAATVAQVRLGVPKVRTYLGRSAPSSSSLPNCILEIRNNPKDSEIVPTKITVTNNGEVLFVDYLPRYAILAAGDGSKYWAVATEDGSVYIYSINGRRIAPGIVLESCIAFLESNEQWLLAISSVGIVHLWNIDELQGIDSPSSSSSSSSSSSGYYSMMLKQGVSLAPILDSSSKHSAEDGLVRAPKITAAMVTDKGNVVVTLSNGDSFTFSQQLCVWVRVSESWWAAGSQYWDTTTNAVTSFTSNGSNNTTGLIKTSNSSSPGVISLLEQRANEDTSNTFDMLTGNVRKGTNPRGKYLQHLARKRMLKEGYEHFEQYVSSSHLETRMASAQTLQSWDEFCIFTLMYAERLADEGQSGKLDELCGQLFSSSSSTKDNNKEKEEKHQLLKKVIAKIGKYRQVSKISGKYAVALGIIPDIDTI